MRPTTITEVLNALDRIINTSIANNDPAGLFAFIYRRTTDQVQRAIAHKSFEDGLRMERFDVAFANLYLDAYENWRQGAPTAQCWATAFEGTHAPLAIIQHILLGMNAHINYDLAIAASSLMKGQPLLPLKSDFTKVNDILASLVNELQDRLSRVSPLFFLLDWLGKDQDESVINFSMSKARAFSWELSCELWRLEGAAYDARLQQADQVVHQLGAWVAQPPGWVLRNGLRLVQTFESPNVGDIIEALRR
ncbi:MAG: DUF5995 family protein [Phaeodactylibacter sp.]|uniref:DUF5995 family protein n=1 Tax=Phaeodactylibacter sp. TaxID=1940289 RepID=UPI0032EF450D